MEIKNFEIAMWEAARNRDSQAFLQVVAEDAVMICGGYRCSGAEYARIITDFDVASYQITEFEMIVDTATVCQVQYHLMTTVSDVRNSDLAGQFYITSTWKKTGDTWKLIFNMDSRM